MYKNGIAEKLQSQGISTSQSAVDSLQKSAKVSISSDEMMSYVINKKQRFVPLKVR